MDEKLKTLIPMSLAKELAQQLTLGQAAIIAEELAARLERHFVVEPTLNLTEAAKSIGVSVTVMRQLCRERRIPAIRLDKSYRIRVIDINNYLAAHMQTASGPDTAPGSAPARRAEIA